MWREEKLARSILASADGSWASLPLAAADGHGHLPSVNMFPHIYKKGEIYFSSDRAGPQEPAPSCPAPGPHAEPRDRRVNTRNTPEPPCKGKGRWQAASPGGQSGSPEGAAFGRIVKTRQISPERNVRRVFPLWVGKLMRQRRVSESQNRMAWLQASLPQTDRFRLLPSTW